ncbi:NAD(P)H-dependent oxidoreductase subunit E [Candidatus Poribacteria bacterium]|nr:NAD(P)H-dependent oxidoreductase subunit E [Candidatus Poribacteria bacterium]
MNRECTCEGKGVNDEFTAEQWKLVDDVVRKYRGKPGALIPVLEEVQSITGYLPESMQRRVAKGLGIPLSQVYGVVTFYSFFTMTPRGKHQVRVCLGTACHVRGAKRVLEEMERKLGIEPGGCTDDRQFSLDLVRCVGACGLGPVVVVDEETHKQVKVAKLDAIVDKYRAESPTAEE